MTNQLVIPDDFPPLYRGHPQIERLKSLGDFVHYETMAADGDELAGRLLSADVVVNVQRFNTFDRALLELLPPAPADLDLRDRDGQGRSEGGD